MPAARLTTSAPSRRCGAISATRPDMSCGLTTSTSVVAIFAASTLLIVRTP